MIGPRAKLEAPSLPEARGFWSQEANGHTILLAITYTADEAMVVWDALRRGRAFVIEREHDENRYRGRFVRGWSEDDGYFYAESPDEDPGSKHCEAVQG